MGDQERWDAWNAEGGPRYPHEKVVQFTFRNFPADRRTSARALDLGCGGGVHTLFLAREGFDVTAFDISPVGVETTRQRLAEFGLVASVEVRDLAALTLDASRFDLVVCVGVFECVDPAVAGAAVRQVHSSLRPGGRALFIFASDRDFRTRGENPYSLRGWTRTQVEKAFAVGFSELYVDQYLTTYRGGEIEQNDWLITAMK